MQCKYWEEMRCSSGDDGEGDQNASKSILKKEEDHEIVSSENLWMKLIIFHVFWTRVVTFPAPLNVPIGRTVVHCQKRNLFLQPDKQTVYLSFRCHRLAEHNGVHRLVGKQYRNTR